MARQEFTFETCLACSVESAFDWHESQGAFQRLLPPWLKLTHSAHTGGVDDGKEVVLYPRIGPFSFKWQLKHSDYIKNQQFVDFQIKGPFKYWKHTHLFKQITANSCSITDKIEFELPAGELGKILGKIIIEPDLKRTFAYRQRILTQDLKQHQKLGLKSGRVLISGASGLIGSQLVPFLRTLGLDVLCLVRNTAKSTQELLWNPNSGLLDLKQAGPIDAVIHLSGEPISNFIPFVGWSEKQKEKLWKSRIESTDLLARTLTLLPAPPRKILLASAVGIYGDTGEREVDENQSIKQESTEFLTRLGVQWEKAIDPIKEKVAEVIHLRLGNVLDPRGGALKALYPVFNLGGGGRLGSGNQYTSWISLDDAVYAISHLLCSLTPQSGAFNLVSPNPLTNNDFSKTLAKVLHRPCLLPAPEFVLKKVFKEVAEELLLKSIRVVPKRLVQSGFEFSYPELEGCLKHCLGRG